MSEHPGIILLVDDNHRDRELAVVALERARLSNEIVEISDGAEALEYLFGTGAYAGRDPSDLPYVVLLDLQMPRVGGMEVLERIRQDPRTSSMPVVVMTGSVDDADRLRRMDLQVDGYILKPINFERFHQIVLELGMYWLVVGSKPVNAAN